MNSDQQLNTNLRDELATAKRQLKNDQKLGMTTLDNIYRRGAVPNPPLNGRYWGELLTSNFHPVLDNWLDIITKIWLPWEGKTFDTQTNSGNNLFTNDFILLGRLIWPFYHSYVADGRGRSLAFRYQTSIDPCLLEPDITVLRMSFALPDNPQFLIRDLVDELVQIDDDFYLGKSVLKHPEGGWFCAAYFTLRSGLVSP